MSQVRKISKLSDLPVRVLVVSNHHNQHTGDPAQCSSADVALIVQQNAEPRLPVPAARTAGAGCWIRFCCLISTPSWQLKAQ